MENLTLQATVNFYAQKRYFGHIKLVCRDALSKHHDNPMAVFWDAFASGMEGSSSEAVRELQTIGNSKVYALAIISAQIQFHRAMKLKDREALSRLKTRQKEVSKTNDAVSLLFAATYFWHIGKHKNARQCIIRVLDVSPENIYALELLGWVDLTCDDPELVETSVKYFDKAIDTAKNSQAQAIDMFRGRAAYFRKQGEFNSALEDMNEVIVRHPLFVTGLIEKAEIQISMDHWDDSLETIKRANDMSASDSDAAELKLLYMLVQTNDIESILNAMETYIDLIKHRESGNKYLFCNISSAIARLSRKDERILGATMKLMATASELDPDDSTFLCETAYQYFLKGMIRCHLADGDLTSADQKYGFLSDIQDAPVPESLVMGSEIEWKVHKRESICVDLLVEASKLLHELSKSTPRGFSFYRKFNPVLMLEISTLLMEHVGPEMSASADRSGSLSLKKLLEQLTKNVPGMVDASMLLARVKFLSGDIAGARSVSKRCLKLDQKNPEAYLLNAEINFSNKNYKHAEKDLDAAVSYKFEIRRSSNYHLLKAKILIATNNIDEAMKLLESGINLPGIKKASSASSVPVRERVSMFLELSLAKAKIGAHAEASKILQDAKNVFKGTSQADRISLVDSDICVYRGNVDDALRVLRSIKHGSSFFLDAKTKMADIYLKHKRNKSLYVRCFQDMVAVNPSSNFYILLGNAYLRTQDPRNAVKSFEAALEDDPDNVDLYIRIGRALLTTHDYEKAIEVFENALESHKAVVLSLQLGELYLQFGKYDLVCIS
eukprot:163918_1